MTPWAGALVWPILLGITSGFDLRIASRHSNESFISERASVSAGPCQATPSTITIPAGDYADFTSPNYPSNFAAFQKCSWIFQTDTASQLSLSCDPVALSWFASLYVVVDGTRYTKSCLICVLPATYQYAAQSNTATVGLQNDFLFTNKGFSCRISSVPRPSNTGCKCGVVQPQRIVGGHETTPNKYPWMVLLVSPGANSNFCGGSLISDSFVLTAAHCTKGKSASEIQVRLGIHDKFTTPTDSLRTNVLQIIQHPLYSSSSHTYDASLLRISAVDFTSYPKIRPICLPTGSNTYAGQEAITAGWGTTYVGSSTSPVLLEVTVPVLTNSACNALLGNAVTASMICAGSTGLDSCQGDSGGPLFLSGGPGYQVIIGIVSWGYGCGDAGYPGVYARTTVIKSWIDSQLSGSTVCSPP